MSLEIDPITVTGRWWRHVPAGVDPAARPVPAGDNRWQHGQVVDALYLADSQTSAWTTWYRHLAEAGLPAGVALPRDMWRYDLWPLEAADLSSTERLARVGLPRPQPGRRGWPAFQTVGEDLHRQGWRGVLTTSAAGPASQVLVVFLPEPVTIPAELVPDGHTRIGKPPAPPTRMRT